MKKLIMLLLLAGGLATAQAQTQRLNRTTTRTTNTRTTQPAAQPATTNTTQLPARNTDPYTENSSGVNGIDGSVNTPGNSGMNRSSSLNYNYNTNDVAPTSVPAVATPAAGTNATNSPSQTAQPAQATPSMRTNTTR